MSEYSFIVLVGKLKIVTDQQERAKAITRMVETAKAKPLSSNFLQAYGLQKRQAGPPYPWTSL